MRTRTLPSMTITFARSKSNPAPVLTLMLNTDSSSVQRLGVQHPFAVITHLVMHQPTVADLSGELFRAEHSATAEKARNVLEQWDAVLHAEELPESVPLEPSASLFDAPLTHVTLDYENARDMFNQNSGRIVFDNLTAQNIAAVIWRFHWERVYGFTGQSLDWITHISEQVWRQYGYDRQRPFINPDIELCLDSIVGDNACDSGTVAEYFTANPQALAQAIEDSPHIISPAPDGQVQNQVQVNIAGIEYVYDWMFIEQDYLGVLVAFRAAQWARECGLQLQEAD